MRPTRRAFLRDTTYAGANIAAAGALRPVLVWATTGDSQPYLTGIRMTATPATRYRAYRSKPVGNPATTTWVQVDLKKSVAVEAVQLFPASERMYPGKDQYYGGEGFPLRFRIDVSNDVSFNTPARSR